MKKKRKYYGEFIENKKIHLAGKTLDVSIEEYEKDVGRAITTVIILVVAFVIACVVNYIWR